MSKNWKSFRQRAALLISGLVLAASLPAAARAAEAKPDSLRIGYQKYGILVILKSQGNLEKRLKQQGIKVEWTEFPFGPPLLEAINVGSIDVGTVGEAPPVFAQAARADLVYIGAEPAAVHAEAIVVPKNSGISKIADLKGKKVVVAKGSNAHYLLVKLLEKGGLKYSDIEPVYLPPADARAAFDSGRVDAWSIWDPFLAGVVQQTGAKIIADGTGAVDNHQFYLSSRSYASKYPQIIKILNEEIAKTDQWVQSNPKAVAQSLSSLLGIDAGILEVSVRRLGVGVTPVGPDILAKQQKIGDAFYQLKLIPQAIKPAEWAWDVK